MKFKNVSIVQNLFFNSSIHYCRAINNVNQWILLLKQTIKPEWNQLEPLLSSDSSKKMTTEATTTSTPANLKEGSNDFVLVYEMYERGPDDGGFSINEKASNIRTFLGWDEKYPNIRTFTAFCTRVKNKLTMKKFEEFSKVSRKAKSGEAKSGENTHENTCKSTRMQEYSIMCFGRNSQYYLQLLDPHTHASLIPQFIQTI